MAIRKFALRPREDGETAFPDLGAIISAVRSVRSRRLNDEENNRRKDEQEAFLEDRRLHPEKYIPLSDLMKKYKNKPSRGAK